MLGRVICAWREKEGLTIREAAKLIGFSYSTLSRIENGMSVDGRNLKKLLRWLLQEDAKISRHRAVGSSPDA